MRTQCVLFFVAILLWNSKSNSQTNSEIYLNGHGEKNYYKYFDSTHTSKKEVLQILNHSYECYVVFKIDTTSNIKDFELIEIPGAPLPDLTKRYIEELFTSTNGKWEQKTKGLKNVPSGDLLFSLSLLKTNQPMEERFRDLDKSFEFALRGLQLHKRLRGYNLLNEKILTLSF